MLGRLERDDWTWLDGVLDRQIKSLLSEAQAGSPLSHYLSHGQFSTSFGVVQGLIRAEIANKRKEFEKLAEARANQAVVEAEKISAAVAQIPAFEITLEALSQTTKTAGENEAKIAEVLEMLESSRDSGKELFDELTELLSDAKTEIANAVAETKSATETAHKSAAASIKSFVSEVEDENIAAAEAKDAALESQANAEKSDALIQKLLADLGTNSDAAQLQIKASNDALEQKTTELKEATLQLQKARADLNRQGLADAFAARVTELSRAKLWTDAAFYLLLISAASYLGWAASKALPNDYLVVWLQKLAPLGIVIWLGWVLAGRSNVLSRLIEDYAFKAATALAFQGYRSEMGSNEELLDLASLSRTPS